MADTIHGSFREAVAKHPDRVALRHRVGRRMTSMTYAELDTWVEAAAVRLAALGVQKGDAVGILSRNRPQWVITDLAALSLGAAVVPLYPTLPPSYLQYIMADSKMPLLVAGDSDLMSSIETITDETPDLRERFLFDASVLAEGSDALASRAASGGSRGEEGAAQGGEGAADDVGPDDLATIVYTSGTTGAPKGVMLTHGNIVSNARALIKGYGITHDDSIVSYLPLSHMFERTCGYYVFLFSGSTITYARDIISVQEAVQEAHPTVLIAVPRVLEKAHAAARWRIEGDSPRKKALVLKAVASLNELANRRYRGERVSPLFAARCGVYDWLVASKFRKAAGGRLRLIVSGGASLDKQVAKVLFVVGFNVVEGYGMTEASPVIACNPADNIRLGTVGKPIRGVEVRIGEQEEILVRGPNVMKGYLGRPEETSEALDADGWLRTGDQGSIDADGYLSITGRLKDLIVTSYGKNISPRQIEERIARSRYIAQVMVCGDNRKFLAALAVPEADAVVEYAGEKGIPHDDYEALLRRSEIRHFIWSEIERANAGAPSYEHVRGFELLPEQFSLENGMLTPTLKPRRGRITMIYADLIDALYKQLEVHGEA
jgi:long-chain acyl-CoA synthetase